METKQVQVAVIGSGFGSLTAAVLLAKAGLHVAVLEQNKYPGGCATSYKRKGFWFETGATTLVGLDEGMPLQYLIRETGMELDVLLLQEPMVVRLSDGTQIMRYADLEKWIQEAERVFGPNGQRAFWETCYGISQQVWQTSLQQLSFPFSTLSDVVQAAKAFRWQQLSLIPKAFKTVKDLLATHGLLENQRFVDFIDQQLLITAQNTHAEVNLLFGATALCYTLYGNYYVPGGMRQLSEAAVTSLQKFGGQILYRTVVQEVTAAPSGGYIIKTEKGLIEAEYVISGLPLNNTHQLFSSQKIRQKLDSYLFKPSQVNGAFTWAIAFQRSVKTPVVLHHQLHVLEGVPFLKSKSIFVSLSHPEDKKRAAEGICLASVSTHVVNPKENWIEQKRELEHWLVEYLADQGFFEPSQVEYVQAATPGAWLDWTGRMWGQVGGYPQYRHIKPWHMKDARLDGKKAYLCGDTVYPGQGIPGVCLSGIIAANKLLRDHF